MTRIHVPSLEEIKLDQLSANLHLASERATDALKWFNRGDMAMICAELFYLREYLDRADEALKYVGKKKYKRRVK